MIQSWLAKRIINWVMARLRAGDIRPTLALDAADVKMTFPGRNSWSGTYRGKQELRPWLQRLARVGLQLYADEVVAVGPPWNTNICVRGRDYLKSADGEVVYENRYVIWGKLRWGRMREYETYEDTEKATELDAWLEQHEAGLALAS